MLHLATYIMMPFMADSVFGAPVPQVPGSTNVTVFEPQNSTSIPVAQAESSTTAGNLTLIAQLENAPTAVDRIKLLSVSDHVYDFNNPPLASALTMGDGGHTVKADRKDFPALIGNGVSMTVGFLGPCGFNTPHTHPRSAEINIVVEGELGTEYVLENGAPLVRNRLSKYQMTVFPQGALHTEWNPDCTDAVFVAGFASEDPGVLQAAQRTFDFDDDVLEAMYNSDFTFNGADIDTFRSLIPANVAYGVESCLAKCGIAKRKR
jgi:Cupin